MYRSTPRKVFIALSTLILTAGIFPGAVADPATATSPNVVTDPVPSSQELQAARSDTADLERLQQSKDAANTPDLATPNTSAPVPQPEGDASGITELPEAAAPEQQISGAISQLRVSLLDAAWAVDRSALTFSWNVAAPHVQTAARVLIFARRGSATPLVTSAWQSTSRTTAVRFSDVASALADNQLYYWTVEVRTQGGQVLTSERSSFATAVGGQFTSTTHVWPAGSPVAALVRGQAPAATNLERALLTVTASDTEAARRHVFTVYVNDTEIGVGPTRRQGGTQFYNTWDVTDALRGSTNTLGVYAYSGAKNAGVLMQLTYYYATTRMARRGWSTTRLPRRLRALWRSIPSSIRIRTRRSPTITRSMRKT
ncbi:hypothetical protein [Neoactinobaculum massilliense]|uniref:glycoside hydrolase family 78 protein n=1 Tax=Neoactinobaculum massilliense TaxID=2364794 RepID=UPI000F53C06D|nr:hypothetical protein [Neoactinobaculum massilliense]